jgi:hypothetical protein
VSAHTRSAPRPTRGGGQPSTGGESHPPAQLRNTKDP